MSMYIVYHPYIEQDEFPSPNSTNEPGTAYCRHKASEIQ